MDTIFLHFSSLIFANKGYLLFLYYFTQQASAILRRNMLLLFAGRPEEAIYFVASQQQKQTISVPSINLLQFCNVNYKQFTNKLLVVCCATGTKRRLWGRLFMRHFGTFGWVGRMTRKTKRHKNDVGRGCHFVIIFFCPSYRCYLRLKRKGKLVSVSRVLSFPPA